MVFIMHASHVSHFFFFLALHSFVKITIYNKKNIQKTAAIGNSDTESE